MAVHSRLSEDEIPPRSDGGDGDGFGAVAGSTSPAKLCADIFGYKSLSITKVSYFVRIRPVPDIKRRSANKKMR